MKGFSLNIDKKMNSPRPQFILNSDKNCLSTCKLQYGISEEFDKILQQQQKVKSSFTTKSQPQTFSDPKDQQVYKHMLNDVISRLCHVSLFSCCFRVSRRHMVFVLTLNFCPSMKWIRHNPD